MRLLHINLTVKSPEASAEFYSRYLLPDATREWLGSSLHLRTDHCDLAFTQGTVQVVATHHGFLAESRSAVDRLAVRLIDDAVSLTDDISHDEFRSIKVLDRDGYECEVYWEASWP